jgi:hypothetical protein
MNVSETQLQEAAKEGLLNAEQAAPLYEYLQANQAQGPRFDFTHVLYYLGGFIAIGAAVIYLGVLWQKNEAAITKGVRQFLPATLRELLEQRSLTG